MIIEETPLEASTIKLTVAKTNDNVQIIFSDDGVGFKTSGQKKKTGIGQQNIQSRLDSINGKISIHSEKMKGTEVRLDIPLLNISLTA